MEGDFDDLLKELEEDAKIYQKIDQQKLKEIEFSNNLDRNSIIFQKEQDKNVQVLQDTHGNNLSMIQRNTHNGNIQDMFKELEFEGSMINEKNNISTNNIKGKQQNISTFIRDLNITNNQDENHQHNKPNNKLQHITPFNKNQNISATNFLLELEKSQFYQNSQQNSQNQIQQHPIINNTSITQEVVQNKPLNESQAYDYDIDNLIQEMNEENEIKYYQQSNYYQHQILNNLNTQRSSNHNSVLFNLSMKKTKHENVLKDNNGQQDVEDYSIYQELDKYYQQQILKNLGKNEENLPKKQTEVLNDSYIANLEKQLQ